jgi:hypothetical protein
MPSIVRHWAPRASPAGVKPTGERAAAFVVTSGAFAAIHDYSSGGPTCHAVYADRRSPSKQELLVARCGHSRSVAPGGWGYPSTNP